MRTYKKIDLYFNGDYWRSTNQSKTCKQAVLNAIESIQSRSCSIGGIGLVESQILKNPKLLKASFSKGES